MGKTLWASACGLVLLASGPAVALPGSGPIKWDTAENGDSAQRAAPEFPAPFRRVNADLQRCSGAVVRLSDDEQAPAVVLSNGHCVGWIEPAFSC